MNERHPVTLVWQLSFLKTRAIVSGVSIAIAALIALHLSVSVAAAQGTLPAPWQQALQGDASQPAGLYRVKKGLYGQLVNAPAKGCANEWDQ